MRRLRPKLPTWPLHTLLFSSLFSLQFPCNDCPEFTGMPQLPSPKRTRTYERQRGGSVRVRLVDFHFSHVPFHLEAREPFDIARQIDRSPHALCSVAG